MLYLFNTVPLLLLLLPCSWALNLLEMVDGPGLQTNLVTVEAVEGMVIILSAVEH